MGGPARLDLLLVEDDEADRALVTGMFRRAKSRATENVAVHVHRATNLLEADRVLETAAPGSLGVILDLTLADATEETALAWIRGKSPRFPIIVLTGNDDAAVPEKALRAGAQDYLVKWEFNADALTRAVSHATERHRIHDELRRAKDAAETANRAKSEFLANMSHEIRTPLGAMLGAVELLAESSLAEDQRRQVDMLNKAGHHLRELIDQVLDLAKIEAGGVALERVGFALDELLTEIEDLFGPRARAKGLELACRFPSERPFVLGDPTRLKQVLLNLIGNAVKFTDQGSVTVTAERDGAGDGPTLRFSVADTGIGIAPDQLTRIFESFTQADASTTRLRGGTGLGLTIARHLVTLMGGRLQAESTLGTGSRFSFSLELSPAPRPPVHARPSLAAWTSLSTDGAMWRPVLIADDSEENRTLCARFLEGAPFEIAFAADGVDALDQYQHLQPGAVLLDLHMPRLDGLAVAKRIREAEVIEHRPRVPLIAFTADAFNETRERCLAAGFTTYLAKPVPRAILREAIAEALRSAPGARLSPPGPRDLPEGFDEDLRDLLPRYVANRLLDAEALRAAFRAGDLARVVDLAHRMKGSGATYGLPILTELGAHIESAAHDGRTVALSAELDRLGVELTRIRDRLGTDRP